MDRHFDSSDSDFGSTKSGAKQKCRGPQVKYPQPKSPTSILNDRNNQEKRSVLDKIQCQKCLGYG